MTFNTTLAPDLFLTPNIPIYRQHLALLACAVLASVDLAAAQAQEITRSKPMELTPLIVDAPVQRSVRKRKKRPQLVTANTDRAFSSHQNTVAHRITATTNSARNTNPIIDNKNSFVSSNSSAGTKTDTPIKEIPQATSVIPREQMDQQNAHSVGESLRYTPGVFADSRIGNVLESVFLRGFGGFGVSAINPQSLNGLPLLTGTGWATQVIDPSTLERIEVLRGPASVLYGQASPGGIVNMVAKEPTEKPYHDVGIETGNRNRAQASFDVSDRITNDGTWSYRLNSLSRRTDTQVDFSKEQRITLAPTISWRPDNNTHLTLFGFYQNDPHNNFVGWMPAQGTVLPNASGRISRNFFLGEPGYDDYSRQQYMLGYKLEHRISNGLTFRQNFRYSHVNASLHGLAGNYLAPFGASSNILNRLASWGVEGLDGIALDNQLQYRLDTGSVRHIFLAGVSYQRTVDDNKASAWTYVPAINYLAPIYGKFFDVPPLSSNTHQVSDRTGAYFQDQIRINQWAITIGGRHDWSDVVTDERLTASSQRQGDHAFTGRAGAVYLFESGIAPYISYSTSFEPTVGVDAHGTAYKPSKAKQTEFGIRYQPDGSSILFSMSLFDIHRTNVNMTDPNNPLYSIQAGEVRSRGLELEARASLSDSTDIMAAYTYLDTTLLKSPDNSTVGKKLTAVPVQMTSLWINHKIAGNSLRGVSLAGGIRYIGKSAGDDTNSFFVPGFVLVDAALRYDLGERYPQLRGWVAGINATNLFDKTYVSSCFSSGGCFYGNGRIVTANFHYKW